MVTSREQNGSCEMGRTRYIDCIIDFLCKTEDRSDRVLWLFFKSGVLFCSCLFGQ
jgi:hypothetical protein